MTVGPISRLFKRLKDVFFQRLGWLNQKIESKYIPKAGYDAVIIVVQSNGLWIENLQVPPLYALGFISYP